MPIIKTEDLRIDQPVPSAQQVYNGLDCCVTLEVFEELQKQFNQPPEVYSFSRALQGPILEIMLRGFAIDETERQQGIILLRSKIEQLTSILNQFAFAVWGKPLNPRSHVQLKDFFYSHMRLPEQWISQKGVRKLSFNREVLEKLEVYFHARPIISCILAIRENAKRFEVLETEISPDGRLRTSYNIAGTETGRLSSSSDAFGEGTNLQNITPELRRMFVADEGWKLCVIDLEQSESREVGWLCGTLFDDWTYLNACESGDLHTTVARLIWPRLDWTGGAKTDRLIADRPFYRHFSYRDMSKRGGHAKNYYGTDFTISRHLKVPVDFITDFSTAYFSVFPGIPRWHTWVAGQLQACQRLTTPFGFTRHFYGRASDDSTLREAIAFSPQSTTAHRTNLGLYRHWIKFKTQTQLLAQTHDSITFQYRPADESSIIPLALKLMEVELSHGQRRFVIPGEAKIGWNWAAWSENNPNGLKKFNLSQPDTRERLTGINRPFA